MAEELKRKLKRWEYAFQTVHNRKPTKKDIDVAPSEIRDFYIDFYKLAKKVQKVKNGDAPKPSSIRLKIEKSLFNKAPLVRRSSSTDFTHPCSSSSEGSSFPKTNRIENPSSSKESSNNFGESKKSALNFEALRNDQTFRVESIGGCQPSIKTFLSASLDFVFDEDSMSQSQFPNEVDFRKRQNLCKFSFNFNSDDEAEKDEEVANFGTQQFENESIIEVAEPNDEATVSSLAFVPNKKKRVKLNTNFVRIDLKHKNYASRAGRKMKGAVLKRHMLKMKYKKFRKPA